MGLPLSMPSISFLLSIYSDENTNKNNGSRLDQFHIYEFGTRDRDYD